MASTATTRGKYRKQGLGDNLNSWGLSSGLNGNYDVLDEAVHGVQTFALTGNYTLTSTNYTTNDIRNRVLRFTDSSLSAAPTITIPATENWWIVNNATTYILTFGNGSNTATVAGSREALVWTDGTAVYSLSLFESADQTYPGGLSYAFSTTTTDADPGTGTLRLDNATASSATGLYISDTEGNAVDVSAYLLTWDDSTSTTTGGQVLIRSKTDASVFHIYDVTAITDNTGYVDATLSWIAGNGAFTNGDALVVSFQRQGDKGDTGATGAAGTVSATGDGTVGAPGIAFAADTDTGFYRIATGSIGVAVDGVLGLTLGKTAHTLALPIAGADQEVSRVKLKDYSETRVQANTGTTYTVDLENGNVFELTLTGNCTYTFSNPPATGISGSFTLIQKQDGTGSRTVTWPSSVDWAGGTAPTITATASSTDVFTFTTVDGGTTWYGFTAGQAFA